MPTIPYFEYRRLPYIFLVMNLPQVEFFDYLTYGKEIRKKIDAEIEDQQNDVGQKYLEVQKYFYFLCSMS